MQLEPNNNQLSEEKRRQVFLALVETQDQMVPVPESRKLVCEKFDVSEHQVRSIEREGLDKKWPPLMENAG